MIHNFFTEYQSYIFLALGLIVLGFSVFQVSTKSKLKQTGILVDGIVFEQGSSNNFNQSLGNSFSSTKNRITIRFVTKTGEWVTGVLKQDFQIFYTGQYKDGDTVKVYYDQDNPTVFYVDTKQSELAGRPIGSLIGLILLLIGLYKLFV